MQKMQLNDLSVQSAIDSLVTKILNEKLLLPIWENEELTRFDLWLQKTINVFLKHLDPLLSHESKNIFITIHLIITALNQIAADDEQQKMVIALLCTYFFWYDFMLPISNQNAVLNATLTNLLGKVTPKEIAELKPIILQKYETIYAEIEIQVNSIMAVLNLASSEVDPHIFEENIKAILDAFPDENTVLKKAVNSAVLPNTTASNLIEAKILKISEDFQLSQNNKQFSIWLSGLISLYWKLNKNQPEKQTNIILAYQTITATLHIKASTYNQKNLQIVLSCIVNSWSDFMIQKLFANNNISKEAFKRHIIDDLTNNEQLQIIDRRNYLQIFAEIDITVASIAAIYNSIMVDGMFTEQVDPATFEGLINNLFKPFVSEKNSVNSTINTSTKTPITTVTLVASKGIFKKNKHNFLDDETKLIDNLNLFLDKISNFEKIQNDHQALQIVAMAQTLLVTIPRDNKAYCQVVCLLLVLKDQLTQLPWESTFFREINLELFYKTYFSESIKSLNGFLSTNQDNSDQIYLEYNDNFAKEYLQYADFKPEIKSPQC